jgi:hypothetical protein
MQPCGHLQATVIGRSRDGERCVLDLCFHRLCQSSCNRFRQQPPDDGCRDHFHEVREVGIADHELRLFPPGVVFEDACQAKLAEKAFVFGAEIDCDPAVGLVELLP